MERTHVWRWVLAGTLSGMFLTVAAYGQQTTDSFAAVMARMKAAKPEVMQRQQALLGERYDLSNRPAAGITMSRGKPVQSRAAVLHGQPDAQPPDRAFLHATADQWADGERRRADQDVSATRHQGLAAVPSRRTVADP